MKLNMGCGFNKREGYLNLDLSPECHPNLVCDLESLPWPWKDDSVDQVLFNHCDAHAIAPIPWCRAILNSAAPVLPRPNG
jgi:hypothetical protein